MSSGALTELGPEREDVNVLYTLSEDPHTALAQIEAAHDFIADPLAARAALLKDVRRLLRDPAVSAEVTLRIAGAYGVGGARAEIRGPLGLYLGLNAATVLASSDEPHRVALSHARAWLAEPDAVDCLYEFYGIKRDKIDLAAPGAGLHRVGTTSLIFRCSTRLEHERALKCLLPRYFGVRAILNRTDRYKQDHPLKDASVPGVWNSTETTIEMDFVEGPTLADLIRDRLPKISPQADASEVASLRALRQDDIAFIRRVLAALCDVLGNLHELRRSHLDLSPSNIIIKEATGDKVQLALIDFGHNFAVTERVGSSSAIRRAALYVAPELIDDSATYRDGSPDAWRCDAYSLGVILLEMAARRRIEKHDFTRELERLWQGEKQWTGALGLARIVDELIDDNAQRRLLLMPTGQNPFRYLGELIRQETEVQALYEQRSAGVGFGLLRGVALFKPRRPIQWRNLLEVQEVVQESVDDAYRDYPALGWWAGLAIVSWFTVLSLFVALTFADLHVYGLTPVLRAGVDKLHPRFRLGDVWGNLPGRMVALTFALTQVTYYVNNYSIISPKRLGSRLGRWSDRVLRANTVLLSIPVLWALVWDPRAWPLCSGIGALLVVLNNYLTLRLARRANDVGSRRFSTLGIVGKNFVDEIYSEWWRLMGYYCVSLIAIGILLDVGKAHDARLFAGLVVLINVVKMYRLNCVQLAPQVRGYLSRAVLTLRRAERVPDAAALAATESGEALISGGVRTVLDAWEATLHSVDGEGPSEVASALTD